MIKLQDLINLNGMTYSDTIKPDHKKKIEMETNLIDDDMIIPERPFPENASKETRKELLWLLDYNYGTIDREYIKDGDNINKVFKEYCNDNNLDYDETYYKKILKESTKTILFLKYYYNRPRPYQLAEFYENDEFEIHNLASAKTPSYPSGHTTQGHLMAELLGKKYPEHYDDFIDLAKFISSSRLMARAHYPSDCVFGVEVAHHIVAKIKWE